MISLDALLDAVRGDLERAARAAGEDERAFRAVADELQPFVHAATAHARSPDESAARELRSAAWLLSYRVGDQGMSALCLEALLRSWRGHAGQDTGATCELVRDLLTDGYARGREDRARATLLRTHADATPLLALGDGAMMLVAADPLDADGAHRVAERVGAALLRHDARCVMLHLHALSEPGLDVLAPLWSIAGSARLLGCACVVSGAAEALTRGLQEGVLSPEPVTHIADAREAVNETLRRAGVLAGALPAPLRWMRRTR